jgi:lipopolysaccharide heptosyltransferase II
VVMTSNGWHGHHVTDGSEPALPDEIDGEYDRRQPIDQRLGRAWKRRAKRLVQGVVRAVVTSVGIVSSVRLWPRPPLRPGDSRVRRILVVRVDLIGDVVLSLPAVRALRRAYPAAELDMLVLPSVAGVLVGQPDITRVLTYDPNIWRRPISLLNPRNWDGVRDLVSMLRSARYDLCLSVSGDWGSVLAWISGARRRVGYAGEAYPGLMTDPVPGRRYAVRKHEVEYVKALARAAGGVVSDETRPTLQISPEGERGLLQTLRQLGVAPGDRPVVVLHPGAHNGQAKRWPSANWIALAERLADLGADVLITGASGEAALVGAVVRRAHASGHVTVHDLTGRTSLPELVALLGRSDLLVSGDSGPLHIACALGTPVVGLYGPTDPAISGPLAPDAIVLRREVWCAPCYNASATADCRFANPVCMKGLAPDVVLAAAREQLRRRWPDIVLARSGETKGEHVGSASHTSVLAP